MPFTFDKTNLTGKDVQTGGNDLGSVEPLLPFVMIIEAYTKALMGIKRSALTKENKGVMKLSKAIMIRIVGLSKKPLDDVWIYDYNSVLMELKTVIKIIVPHWDSPLDQLKVK